VTWREVVSRCPWQAVMGVTPLPLDQPPLPEAAGEGGGEGGSDPWLYGAMPPNTEPVAKRHLRFGCTARPTTAVPDWRDGEEEQQQHWEQQPWLFLSGDLDDIVTESLDLELVCALEAAPPEGGGEEEEGGGEVSRHS
jgi:hypothetical protein